MGHLVFVILLEWRENNEKYWRELQFSTRIQYEYLVNERLLSSVLTCSVLGGRCLNYNKIRFEFWYSTEIEPQGVWIVQPEITLFES